MDGEVLRKALFLPERASTFADRVDGLHYFVIITTLVASTVVGLTALYFFVRYRRRTELQQTAFVRPRWWVETLFVAVPLAFFLAWFGIGYRDFVWLQQPPKDAMDVYVVGKQWMWQFSYPEGPNAIDVLRVPAGRPVRLLLTSRDVIHSFYVPEFRVKKDALPGRYTEVWFTATRPGSYEVLCAEYCGLDHSLMRGEVVVMEPGAFDQWRAQQREDTYSQRVDAEPVSPKEAQDSTSLAAQGQRVAVAQGCFKCHTTDGEPHIGPSWLGLYRQEVKLASGEVVVADEAYLTRSMMDPLADQVAGFAAVMPSFQGRLDVGDAAALVELIKSLRGQKGRTP
ncbi:MAG: cytochrome c oxidase subunit II [Myxococcota bacterium]